MSNTVAIIGGGASGLLCAILCAQNSFKVDLYEQNSKCGKKILASGNGRCNITNTNLNIDCFFSANRSFVQDAINEFGFKEFEKFCLSIGLVLDIKDDGRVYPLSNEAKSVLSIFLSYAKLLGVSIFTDSKITDIKKLMSKYDKVVIATGSSAASHLGGNDDGYNFAKHCHHNIIPIYPSLVQLHLSSTFAHKMSGIKIDGEVKLLINNKIDANSRGDILFTNYGISGFAILDISQKASISLMQYEKVDISINLLPSFKPQSLSKHILQMSINIPNSTIFDILSGLLPIKIVTVLLQYLKINNLLKAKDIDIKLSKKVANYIQNWCFEVIDTHGFRHAEVAGGGVDTSEINPKTMQSFNDNQLYFIGEVLDVVGRRGGYNFAFAWASAFLAAKDITNN